MAALRGSAEPRLWTPPLRKLTRRTSLGYEAIDFIEGILDLELMPWQKWWLIHALEIKRNGRFRYRTVLTLVGRQNGKTTLLVAVALWFMYMNEGKTVLGAAQSLEMAREAWTSALSIARADDSLNAELAQVRMTNGQEVFSLESGSRYKIAAANGSAGRGLSTDLLLIDELREQRTWDAWSALSKTTTAKPNSLTIGASNAGADDSVVLNHLRSVALADADESVGIFEWSAPDGCEIDDRSAWAQAMPGLGVTVTEATIEGFMATDPPNVFRTEILCQHVDALGDMAVNRSAWEAAADPAIDLESFKNEKVVLCVDIAPNLGHATVVAAYETAGVGTSVAVIKAWDGPHATEEMRRDLPRIKRAMKARRLGWFPSGPTAALRIEMEGMKAIALDHQMTASACQGFAEQVATGHIIHPDDPLLTNHVLNAKKHQSGDGWRFVRKGVGNVDAAYAAAGAVHLARVLPHEVGIRFIGR